MTAIDTKEPALEMKLELYETMSRIRAADERLRKDISSGRATCFYYPGTGQEAIAAGWAQAIRRDDNLVATYRCLHDVVAKGASLEMVLAEMFGRSGGSGQGRGGPMHIVEPEIGLMCTTGIVGSGLTIANGLALAAKMDGSDKITIASFGDGATNTGSFHEALNLAAVWDLPIIFICQNNGFAETTDSRHTYRSSSLAERGRSYGMPGVTVDGFDPIAVWNAVATAVDRARSGSGPSFLECRAFRYNGHYFGDPSDYISPEHLNAMLERDPVPVFRRRLLGDVDVETLNAIDERISTEIAAAFTAAYASPMLDPSELTQHVYAS